MSFQFLFSGRQLSLLDRGWNSGTIMLWASQLARILQATIILPFAILHFSSSELTIWLIFETISNLHYSADLGFTHVFSRAIAIAIAGVKSLTTQDYTPLPKNEKQPPNLDLLERILSSMSILYGRLTAVVLCATAILGTALLVRPIQLLSEPIFGWFSWAIVLSSIGMNLLGKSNIAYFQGMNQIALINRWLVFTTLGASAVTIFVLLFGGKLLSVVITTQAGLLLFPLLLWILRKKHQNDIGIPRISKFLCPEVFTYVWPATWRSGLGKLFDFLTLQSSGILFAQILSPTIASSYLLAYRLLYAIRQFSSAPFLSQIPALNQLRAMNNRSQLTALAKKRATYVYFIFALCIVFVGTIGSYLLLLAKKDIQFPPISFWALLGIAGLAERYGAIHIQLYSMTNHILWHIANGITGLLFVSFCLLLYPTVQLYAFPLALLASNLGFYTWYAAKYSHAEFGFRFLTFDLPAVGIPVLILLVYFGQSLF